MQSSRISCLLRTYLVTPLAALAALALALALTKSVLDEVVSILRHAVYHSVRQQN
jgi:hypothetical protein